MRIYKMILTVTLSLALCMLCGCREQSVNKMGTEIPAVTGKFEVTVLKVGQADAIFMQTENNNFILDCGEKDDGDELVELLHKKGISNVDYIFITHFDKDHVGGFPEVMENVTADNIVVPDYHGNNDEYEAYSKAVNNMGLKITTLTEDTSFILDDVLFEISVPKKKEYAEGDNDFSLVLSVTHGENTFLFAGDAEAERLSEIMSEFGKQYDFLKVPHHGKHNKNTKNFLNTVKPQYAVICDSDKNSAEKETMSILKTIGSEAYNTRNGDVFVISDGRKIEISQ